MSSELISDELSLRNEILELYSENIRSVLSSIQKKVFRKEQRIK